MSQCNSRGAFLGPLFFFILLAISVYLATHRPREEFIPADLPEDMRSTANQWLDRTLQAFKIENTIEGEFDHIIRLANQQVPEGQVNQQFGLVVSKRLSQEMIREEWPQQSVRQAFSRLCALGQADCKLNAVGQFVIMPK